MYKEIQNHTSLNEAVNSVVNPIDEVMGIGAKLGKGKWVMTYDIMYADKVNKKGHPPIASTEDPKRAKELLKIWNAKKKDKHRELTIRKRKMQTFSPVYNSTFAESTAKRLQFAVIFKKLKKTIEGGNDLKNLIMNIRFFKTSDAAQIYMNKMNKNNSNSGGTYEIVDAQELRNSGIIK